MRVLTLAVLLLGLVVVPVASAAQQVSAEPTYGDVRLEGGFLPDPHQVKLTAGGSIEVDEAGCDYGHVANAPDVDLFYDGNSARTLYISAVSDEDTMLLINDPNGKWSCNDDGLAGLNPLVVVGSAPSGLYNIWIGTYGDDMAAAVLSISEIDPR